MLHITWRTQCPITVLYKGFCSTLIPLESAIPMATNSITIGDIQIDYEVPGNDTARWTHSLMLTNNHIIHLHRMTPSPSLNENIHTSKTIMQAISDAPQYLDSFYKTMRDTKTKPRDFPDNQLLSMQHVKVRSPFMAARILRDTISSIGKRIEDAFYEAKERGNEATMDPELLQKIIRVMTNVLPAPHEWQEDLSAKPEGFDRARDQYEEDHGIVEAAQRVELLKQILASEREEW